MRKEVILAILAGAFFGLIIAFGLWRLNATISPDTQNQSEASPTPTPEFGITIADPEMGQVVTESPTTITGITKPNAFVVASTDDEDYLVKAESDGGFAIEVDVVGGVNQVLIAAIDESGKMVTTSLTIAHSTEITSGASDKKDQEESTDSSDVVREKVQDKVAEARSVPQFYMGTVTDIAENSIQTRTSSGKIKQVASDGDTTFVTLVNDTEEIEFSDVAIGDFLVAMGLINSNHVLDAQRVLITTPPGEIEREIVAGKIINISSQEVVISKSGEQEITLDFPKSWKGPDLDELSEGETLIAVGEADESTVSIRSIFQTK